MSAISIDEPSLRRFFLEAAKIAFQEGQEDSSAIQKAVLCAQRIASSPEVHELRIDSFSFFRLLQLQHREYVHSNVLKWLLDRWGSHRLGPKFFRALLAHLRLPLKYSEDQSYRVSREERGDQSIIDIRIQGREFVIDIENKVHSAEGLNQTLREMGDLMRAAGDRKKHGIFLTLRGDDPVDKGFAKLKYGEIASIIRTLTAAEPVQTFLNQYLYAIEQDLLGGVMSEEFNGFTKGVSFLAENFKDLDIVLQLHERAKDEVWRFLRALGRKIETSDWWAPSDWSIDHPSEDRTTNYFYFYAKRWVQDDDALSFVVGEFEFDQLTAKGNGGPSLSIYLPADLRKPSVVEGIRKLASGPSPALPGYSPSKDKYPLTKIVSPANVFSNPQEWTNSFLNEIEKLIKVAPTIDRILKTAKGQPPE